MKKIPLFFLLAGALLAQPAPEPTLDQIKQLATIMRQQRDSLSQQLLDTQSQLQLVAQENEKLKKEVADLTTKVAELTPKKP